MITKIDKNSVRQRRHARVRKHVSGTAETPRLNVCLLYTSDAADE